jgi:hypothetical protein
MALSVSELGFGFHRMSLHVSASYSRSKPERINSVIGQMAAAIRTLANSSALGTGISLEFSCSLGEGDCLEKVDVVACPCLPSVPNEIVRAKIDKHDFATAPLPVCDLLRLEIEPFIIGVGWVIVDETIEGVVIRLCDLGKIQSRHER